MKCSLCKTGEVSVIAAAQVDGAQAILKLCAACAKKQHVPFAKSLSVSPPRPGGAVRRTRAGGRCPACGFTWRDFRECRFVGCASCYASLGAPLARHLRRLHGAVRHEGRRPERLPSVHTAVAADARDLFSEIVAAAASGDRERIGRLRAELERPDESR